MWIRIDRMRILIHKIWWMRIQIQSGYFFRLRLEKYDFLPKQNPKLCSLNSAFPFIWSSGSTDPKECVSDRIGIHITGCMDYIHNTAKRLIIITSPPYKVVCPFKLEQYNFCRVSVRWEKKIKGHGRIIKLQNIYPWPFQDERQHAVRTGGG